MNDRPAAEPTSALHIGWWRNGFHPYERPELTNASESEIRNYGGRLAAVIAAGWLASGIIGGFVNPDVQRTLLALLIPPVFIVFFLGRRLAVKAVTSEFRLGLPAVIRLAVVTVALNSFAVAFETLVWNLVNPSYWDASRPTLGEVVVGLPFATILVGLLGIVIFGPLAIGPASVSAGLWSYLMRRRFTTPGPLSGVPGSGDRPRS